MLVCSEVPYDVSRLTAASCTRSRLPRSSVGGQDSMMCDTVWMSLQSHISLSVRPHFFQHSGRFRGGRAGSAPPPLGDGLKLSLMAMLANAKS